MKIKTTKFCGLLNVAPIRVQRSSRLRRSITPFALLKTDPDTKTEWSQDPEEVTVRLLVSKDIKSKSVSFSVHPTRLELLINNQSYLTGSLSDVGEINVDGCYWFMDDTKETEETKCLTVVLQKAELGHQSFDHVLESDISDITITNYVYVSLAIDGEEAGVMMLGLFGKAAPTAVSSFLSYANEGLWQKKDQETDRGEEMSLKNAWFKVVYPTLYATLGAMDDSKEVDPMIISLLQKEKRGLKHDTVGLLSVDPQTTALQYFVTFDSVPQLDQQGFVFGKVTYGLDLLARIESIGDIENGEPSSIVKITDCGEVSPLERDAIIKTDQKRRIYETD